MDVYVLSAHGSVNFGVKYTVPANCSVVFYTKFGVPLSNSEALKIQTAVARGLPSPVRAVALYNGGAQMPGTITVTGDNHIFYSGVVEAPDATVIKVLYAGTDYTLDSILQELLARSPGGVTVHYLACLGAEEYARWVAENGPAESAELEPA